MTPLDGSIVSVALKPIAGSLHLSYTEAIWVQAAHLLAISVCLVPFGRLADQHGRTRFFLAGVLVFTAGSVASGLAPDAAVLLAARVVQGAGRAAQRHGGRARHGRLPAGGARPRPRLHDDVGVRRSHRGAARSAGLIVQHLTLPTAAESWRWIFYVNIPVGAVTLLAGRSLLAAERHDRAVAGTAPAASFDTAGAVLLALALATFIVPLTFGFQWGWASPGALGLLATAALAGVAFVAVERRRAHPVLDISLLRHNRLFATANLAALLNYAAMNAVTVLTAVFLEVVQHRSPQVTGFMLIAQTVLMAALSEPAGRLSDRIGTRGLASGGMIVIAAGLALLATMPQAASTARVMSALAVVGLGMAAFSAPNTSAVMGAVDRSRLGAAASFLATMRFTGQAMSVALLGGIAGSRLGPVGGKVIFLGRAGGRLGRALRAGLSSGDDGRRGHGPARRSRVADPSRGRRAPFAGARGTIAAWQAERALVTGAMPASGPRGREAREPATRARRRRRSDERE